MLGVAHPSWRTLLAKEARALPSMQGVDAIAAQLIELQDGRHAVLRPATKDDIAAIGEYIVRLSGDDRRTRYMGTVTVDHLTSPERLSRLYHDTLDYRQHAAFIVELDDEIIGVAHAFRIGDTGTYEVSFSRRSDLRGQGIGRHLMQMLIDWGAMGAQDVLRHHLPQREPAHARALRPLRLRREGRSGRPPGGDLHRLDREPRARERARHGPTPSRCA